MPQSSRLPGLPFPRRPEAPSPERAAPARVPLVDFGGGNVQDRLAEQRTLVVGGPLDAEATTGLVAQLMAFDGISDRDVEIVISGPGGPLSEIFPVLDVLELMRASVNVTAIGSVSATAVGLVAACRGERRAAAHARFSLRLDAVEAKVGTVGDLASHAEQLMQLRSRYLSRLTVLTGQDEGTLAEQIDHGRWHSAEEAEAMGVVDTVVGRS